MEELLPLEEVELADGEVVICWGDTSMELSPPEEVAEASDDSGLSRFSSGLVWLCRSRGGFLGAISAFRLHRDILNSWLNLAGEVWWLLSTNQLVTNIPVSMQMHL